MTIHAAVDGKNVKVNITYGPVTASVTEEVAHVRSFHDQLGRLLDEIDKGTSES